MEHSDMDKRVIKGLQRIVGKEHVLSRSTELQVYEYDASLDRHLPEVVVLPSCTEEVAAVARLTHQLGMPVVPRGAGTNLSGGSIPLRGGVVLGLSRMDLILDIDVPNRRAVVQPGVYNLDLQNALSPYGYLYAPDPASQAASTLGGNAAENSGGPHCFKYGVTTNHVLGLQVVLPDGEVVRLSGGTLDPPGYDLTGLFIGSEGTFGTVTEITCRILRKPEAIETMLAVFNSIPDAGEAVSAIIAAGIVPATLEMMDKVIIKAVEESVHAGYPLDAEAVLIIELDGVRDGMDRQAGRIREVCAAKGAREVRVAASEKERDDLWAGRRGAFGAVARLAPSKLVTDVTVPRTNLPAMLRRVMEIGQEYHLLVGNVFHAGDGNLHPNILFDPRDEDEVARVRKADHAIVEAAVAFGGTITGEHGIGMQKIKGMNLILTPEDIRAQWRVKWVFDPLGLSNPGKVLPEVPPAEERPPLAPGAADLVSALAEVVGAGSVPAPAGRAIVVEPETGEATADVLALATQRGAWVAIRGGAAAAPHDCQVLLSTARLAGIVEHDADNLTVTVRAGTPWREMQSALARAGQWVSLDAPGADRGATVGGVVASNASGPRRLRSGSARDLVLGMRVASAGGDLIRCGGKTVKNVSGYDVTKLFIGSMGSLGAIVEVTFRTVPLPEAAKAVVIACPDATAACEFARGIVDAQMVPSALEFLNADATRVVARASDVDLPGDTPVILADFEDVCEAVDREARETTCAAEAAGLGHPMVLEGAARARMLQAVADLSDSGPADVPAVACKICCPTVGVADVIGACAEVCPCAPVVAGLQTGVVHLLAGQDTIPSDDDRLGRLADGVAALGGTLTVIGRTGSVRAPGRPPEGLGLMRGLKHRFDPADVLPVGYQFASENA